MATNGNTGKFISPAVLGRRDLLKTCLLPLGAASALAAFAQNAPSRPAFEVASIKPAASGQWQRVAQKMTMETMMSSRPPGWMPMDRALVTLRNQSLTALVATAYRVRANQVEGPPWMGELGFDIDAKIPDGAPPESANEMLQSLLEERFGLQLHRENRDLQGYALIVGKNGPKLTDATAAIEPPKSDGLKNKDEQAVKSAMDEMKSRIVADKSSTMVMGVGMMSNRWSRRSATTAQLAEYLSVVIHRPVVDMTALTGNYDIVLEIQQSADEGPESAVSRPLAKLGLKLEQRKVPTAMFVVDHIEKTPTAN